MDGSLMAPVKEQDFKNILELPVDLQILILKKLTFKELILFRRVSKHFANLIQSEFSSLIIKEVSLPNTFPNKSNMDVMPWLSSKGNLEATIKLAIAHLYHEGLTDTASNRQENSSKAAEYFCDMEKHKELKAPLTWVLVRPPWSSASVCRKAFVVRRLIKMCDDGVAHPEVLFCIGKVFQLFEDDDQKRQSAKNWLERATECGLPDAEYELWKMELDNLDRNASIETIFASREPGLRLSLMRRLRKVAACGHYPAQVQLNRLYALGQYGGLPIYSVLKSSRQFFSESCPISTKPFDGSQARMNSDMRFILVDWLIEVATMKNFSSETLHSTVQCVDRFLRLRKLSRSYLQLLGIACMVLCTRSIERDVLTIREAVWLTDSAYKYEELVRMMEDVVATLRGNIKDPSPCNYLSILLNFSEVSREAKAFAKFLGDVSLLYADVITHPPATVASACLLLANLTANAENPWSIKMKEFTGFTVKDIAHIALKIHRTCICREFLPEYKNLSLNSIEERFSQGLMGPMKLSQAVTHDQLTAFLESSTANNSKLQDFTVNIIGQEFEECNNMKVSSQMTCVEEISQDMFRGDKSLDEELETDTPPTLSCAYIVKPDTKTRKRIRTNVVRNSNAADFLPLKESCSENAPSQTEMPSSSTLGPKVFDSKVSDKQLLKVHNRPKNRSLSPKTVSAKEKENSWPEKQPKVSRKARECDMSAPCCSKSMKSMR